MKAHIFRELVNDLRDIATQWHGSQQLRERISGRLRQDVSINDDPANDGWVSWAGGKCPVSPDTLVDVKVKPRHEVMYRRFARNLEWSHNDPWCNHIDFYRIAGRREMSSREAFENGPGKELSLAKRNDGTYISVTTDIAWEAWKAVTKRAEEVCQTEMDEQHINFDAWHAAQSCRDAIREGNNDSC